MILAIIYIYLFLQLFVVAWFDLKTCKILNIWPLSNIIIFVVLLIIAPEYYSITLNTFVYSLSFLFVGFTLYALKIMGAGDVKYLFSFYLVAPAIYHESAFIMLLYTTIAVGIAMISMHTIRNFRHIVWALRTHNATLLKGIYGKKLPFAPIILASWIGFGWENKEVIFANF